MRNTTKEDVLFVMQELIDNCEGAIMAAKEGDYLHNFSYMLQEKLRVIRDDIESLEVMKDEIDTEYQAQNEYEEAIKYEGEIEGFSSIKCRCGLTLPKEKKICEVCVQEELCNIINAKDIKYDFI